MSENDKTATSAEPVAWAYEFHEFHEFHEFGGVWARHVILNRPDGGANPPTKHHGNEVRNVRPLYATPPSSGNADAVRVALELLIKYADWQIGEGGSHHPTLPSAIGKARATLSSAPVAGEWQDISTARSVGRSAQSAPASRCSTS